MRRSTCRCLPRSRGALRKELARYLRSGRARRRPRGLPVSNGRGQLRGAVRISGRPAEASARAVPGHWEGDLVFGTRSSTVATLAGRKSRFVMLVGLPGSHTAGVVADALAKAIATLPEQLRRYFPRSTDFRALTQSDLDNVAAELRRANHHDPVMTSHLAMNEPGRIAKIRTAKQEDNQ